LESGTGRIDDCRLELAGLAENHTTAFAGNVASVELFSNKPTAR
jgi:hypothetical protein